jgi:hypothetical protein
MDALDEGLRDRMRLYKSMMQEKQEIIQDAKKKKFEEQEKAYKEKQEKNEFQKKLDMKREENIQQREILRRQDERKRWEYLRGLIPEPLL